MVRLQDLVKISDYEWEIPQSFRGRYARPGAHLFNSELLEQILG